MMDNNNNKYNYKNVTFYDAERKDTKGSGYYSKKFNMSKLTEEEYNDKVKTIRDEQKKRNALYKEKKNEEKKEQTKVMIGEKQSHEIVTRINPNLPTIRNEIDLKLDENTGNTTVLLGSSKMGKSTLLMHLYDKYYSSKEFISILFSINPHINIYKDHKNLIQCNTFNKDTETLIKEQKYINVKCKNKYKFVNMLDDIIDVKFSALISNLILTYRNSNISSLISLQYPKLLNKSARANINNIILFNFNTDETIIDTIKLYLRNHFNKLGFKTFDEQLSLYKELTKNHGFIYLNTINNYISFHRLTI